jgi:hypothetical protein
MRVHSTVLRTTPAVICFLSKETTTERLRCRQLVVAATATKGLSSSVQINWPAPCFAVTDPGVGSHAPPGAGSAPSP